MLLVDLPQEESTFFKLHHAFFPTSFDVKLLMLKPGPSSAKVSTNFSAAIIPSICDMCLVGNCAEIYILLGFFRALLFLWTSVTDVLFSFDF